jgi:hypothetical protein
MDVHIYVRISHCAFIYLLWDMDSEYKPKKSFLLFDKRHVVRWNSVQVSDEHVASIFRLEE